MWITCIVKKNGCGVIVIVHHRSIKHFTWSLEAADDFCDDKACLFFKSLMPLYDMNNPSARTVMHAHTGTSIWGVETETLMRWETND